MHTAAPQKDISLLNRRFPCPSRQVSRLRAEAGRCNPCAAGGLEHSSC